MATKNKTSKKTSTSKKKNINSSKTIKPKSSEIKKEETPKEIKTDEQSSFPPDKLTAENIEKEISSAPSKPKIYDPSDENNINEKMINVSAEEIIKKQLLDYGRMIESNIKNYWTYQIRGTMPKQELISMVNNCSPQYNYEIKYKNGGAYIIIEHKNIKVQIPENNGLIQIEG